MTRRVTSLTLDNLADLPQRCRRCLFWELDPVSRSAAEASGGVELEKEAWLSAVLLEWGSCGKIVYTEGLPAGYAIYAPPVHIPRAGAFPTSPVSADAVLLAALVVVPEFRGGGLARMLVQGMAKDLTRRGVRAVEAFGYSAASAARGRPDADLPPVRPGGPECLVPAEFLLAVGFKTVRPHHRYPRLRLELKGTASWREDVEVALERLLGSMHPEPALRPV